MELTEGPASAYSSGSARPVDRLGLAARLTLGASLIAAIVGVTMSQLRLDLIDRITNGEDVTEAQANAADQHAGYAGEAYVACCVVAGIVFIVWFYRAWCNAQTYGTRAQRHAKGWVVGGWLCPFANFVIPYRITCDIALASGPASGAHRHPLRLVRWWWAFWVSSLVAGFGGNRQTDPQATDRFLQTSYALAVVAAGLAIAVVGRITNDQEIRRLRASDPGPQTGAAMISASSTTRPVAKRRR